MTRRTWQELSPRSRRLIVAGGTVEGLLKVAALVDLARRPAGQVRGAKAAWAAAIVLTGSVGTVPLAYFVWGVRRS